MEFLSIILNMYLLDVFTLRLKLSYFYIFLKNQKKIIKQKTIEKIIKWKKSTKQMNYFLL